MAQRWPMLQLSKEYVEADFLRSHDFDSANVCPEDSRSLFGVFLVLSER